MKHGELYIADKVERYFGQPVSKVEVVEIKNSKVRFKTDYPIMEIELDANIFFSKFQKWG